MSLRDLGEHRLKDLTRPERIFQVCAPDLPSDFPPLKTLDAYRHNLPAQATVLIGREREIEGVTDLLLDPGVRLLTLTGPGGIGKTRLALQAATELLDAFADGVWFIGLAPISDPRLVADAIAAALRVREHDDRTLDEQLKAYLRDKELLLLLDNFEQVAEAASLLAELLAAAPKLKVLVTSRAPLHLYGEREYAAPPLTLPERTPPPPLERLTQYEAVRLFIERSQAVRADFAVAAANAPIIAEICYRLDGLPLAIELAAARSKIFAPQAILSRLDRRLSTLTGGARDLPARQQTLRGAIDWSYNLLDAAEQELFARLGVFVGGCTVAAAEAVLAADGDVLIDALDGLTSLLDKSLLRQAEGPNGEPRFVMLETLREYALERLAAGGAEEAVRRAHARFYLALAEEAEPELRRGQQQLEYLHRLEIEHDNLRPALNWALAQDDPSIALRLAGALWRFWLIRSYHKEARRWLEAALARAEGRRELEGSPWRARALLGLAHMCLIAGDFAREEERAQEALAIYRELEDRAGMGYALFLLMDSPYFSGDKATASARLQEGLTYYQAEEDSWGIGLCLHCMGVLAHEQGDHSAAHELLEQSVALLKEVGDRFWMGYPLNELALEIWIRGDTARARTLNEESLTTFRELGSKAELPWVLGSKMDMALSQGDYADAQALADQALAIQREIDPGALVWGVERLGRLAYLQGDLATARAHFEHALQQAQERENQPAIAVLEARLSRLAFHEGDLERAAALLERSLPVYTVGRIGGDRELPIVLAQCGDVACAQGDLERAVECYRQSLAALSQRGAVVGVTEPLEGLAKVALIQDHPERAARLLGAASALRERIGVPVAPVKRAEYGRGLAAAHAVLGETAFDAAWAAGQALPLDQAIAEAMAGADYQGQRQREEHIQVEG